jgi:transcriptional regulator with XRE-family HTH domain
MAAGISQEELGERAELHRTYVGDIERGERNVSLLNMEKIANALKVKLSVLVLQMEKHMGKGVTSKKE